jgi:ribosome-associated protein
MQNLTFQLKDDFIELNKLLKVMGLCESSGAGKVLVASGAVSVDGKVELRKACKIRAGSVVAYQDAAITVTGLTPAP